MGVFVFNDEQASIVAPAKLFKAVAKDADTIISKFTDFIQSVETVEGNGGVGTVKKITGVDDGNFGYVLHKVEAIDEANLEFSYSIVGGTGLQESLEKVTTEIKVVAGPDGGSIVKVTTKFYTKGDAVLPDTVGEETKAKRLLLLKAIEGYVLANPDY